MLRIRNVQHIEGAPAALAALEAHVFRCIDELKRHKVPRLYESGVRYRRPERDFHWRTPRQVLRQGFGHCPDFACWRVAELRVSGLDPGATVYAHEGGRPNLWHVLVRRGDGSPEDPSVVLGMKERNR